MARRVAVVGVLTAAAYLLGLVLGCVLFDHHMQTLKES